MSGNNQTSTSVPSQESTSARVCFGCGETFHDSDAHSPNIPTCRKYCALCSRGRFSLPWTWRRYAAVVLAILGVGLAVAVYYDIGGLVRTPTMVSHCAVYAMDGMVMGLGAGFLLFIPCFWTYSFFEKAASTPSPGNTNEYRPPRQFAVAIGWLGATFLGLAQFIGAIVGWATGFLRLLDVGEPTGPILAAMVGGVLTLGLFGLQPYRRRRLIYATFISYTLPWYPCVLLGAAARKHFQITLLQDWDRLWIPLVIVQISILGYWVGSSVGDKLEPPEKARTKILMGFLLALPSAIAYMVFKIPASLPS